MREPYKVAVWGPGLVGSTALREILALPEFELTGVYAYSASKIGVDIGTYLGGDAIGVAITGDRDAFLSLDTELVIYTATDSGDFASDIDIIDILRSGKSVLTTLPYHYPRARGVDVESKLQAACLEGNSTLYATGLYPGYFPETLGTVLTVPVSGLKHLHIAEMVDVCGVSSPLMLSAFGFGEVFDPDDTSSPAYMTRMNYYKPIVHMLADEMGVVLDSVEGVNKSRVAETDLDARGMHIKEGTVGAVIHDWVGLVDGQPLITLSVNWYVTDEMRPKEADSAECWILTAEGNPSLQCKVDIKHSFENDIPFNKNNLDFAGSGILLVKSIAATIEAPPGIKLLTLNERAWRQDMRLSVQKARI